MTVHFDDPAIEVQQSPSVHVMGPIPNALVSPLEQAWLRRAGMTVTADAYAVASTFVRAERWPSNYVTVENPSELRVES